MFIKCLYKYSFFVDELSAALDKIEEQKGQVVIQRSDDDIQKIADQVKLRHYEKATKFEKNLPHVLAKQLFLLSNFKTSGRFFQIFETFTENLNFNV